jgi:hypothetical protein
MIADQNQTKENKENIHFTLIEANASGFTAPFLINGKRFVDSENGWKIFQKQAVVLLQKTCKKGDWFRDNKYTLQIEQNEKVKYLDVALYGIPAIESLPEWINNIHFQLNDKVIYSRFEEHLLLPGDTKYFECLENPDQIHLLDNIYRSKIQEPIYIKIIFNYAVPAQ